MLSINTLCIASEFYVTALHIEGGGVTDGVHKHDLFTLCNICLLESGAVPINRLS